MSYKVEKKIKSRIIITILLLISISAVIYYLYNKNKTICKILNHFRKKFKPLQIQGFKKNI